MSYDDSFQRRARQLIDSLMGEFGVRGAVVHGSFDYGENEPYPIVRGSGVSRSGRHGRLEPLGTDPGDDARWYGAGEPVTVGPLTLPGGLVYVGPNLPNMMAENEAALINPFLPVGAKRPAHGDGLDIYAPRYSTMTPIDRAGYLAWLAGGRTNREAPPAYAVLFYFGLERRVLIDIKGDPRLNHELPEIRAALVTLRRDYAARHPVLRYNAASLIEAIDLLVLSPVKLLTLPAPPPPDLHERWPVPVELPLVLAAHTAAKLPLPADWAALWGYYHPEVSTRTPAQRCPAEFRQLFVALYHEAHGAGLKVRAGKATLYHQITPANPGLRSIIIDRPDLPDIFASKAAGRRLQLLFNAAADELDSYSRWLARNPEKAGTLAAQAMLPPRLIEDARPAMRTLFDWAEEALGPGFVAPFDVNELFTLIEAGDKPSTTIVTGILSLLGALGYGVEPDPRFGSGSLSAKKPAVIFRLDGAEVEVLSANYEKAQLLFHLAAMVAQADGKLTHHEITQLHDRIARGGGFESAARRRLHAYLLALAQAPVGTAGLAGRIASLTADERAAIGEGLVQLAAADGQIAPLEVSALMKAYKLLGLASETVTSQLHHSLAGGRVRPAPANKPVTVRSAQPVAPGYAIPLRPRPREPLAATPAASAVFALDAAAIAATEAETAVVAGFLHDIFADDPDAPAAMTGSTHTAAATLLAAELVPTSLAASPPANGAAGPDPIVAAPSPTPTVPAGDPVPGLDDAHAALLRALCAGDQEEWPWAAFSALAGEHGLLPAAALDVLNEAAFAVADEPVLDGDDPLRLNDYARGVLLG